MTLLVVAPEAERDLEDILLYLEDRGGKALALRYGESFRDALRHLLQFPRSGPPRASLGKAIRIWLVPPYVLFYRYHSGDDTLQLLRILHERRDTSREIMGKSRRR